MNFNKRNFDTSSEDEKSENEFKDIPKTVVLSSSSKPSGINNQFFRFENGYRKLLKISSI